MQCDTSYIKTEDARIVVVLELTRVREDDPEVWDMLPPQAWARLTSPTLRAKRNTIESPPFEKIEEAREWEKSQLNEIKNKIEIFRQDYRRDWIPGRSFASKYRSLMDTVARVTVYAAERATAEKAVAAAFTRMQQVAGAASIFDDQAEAFRLNREGCLNKPSADFSNLTRLALEFYRKTEGYLDITIQPLLELWATGLWKESLAVQQSKIVEALRLVGADKIEIGPDRIGLPLPGMKITFGAIAKGYAVEEALQTLRSLGVDCAAILAGGEMGTLGQQPDGQLWTIGVSDPQHSDRSLADFQWPADNSVSTSGNYERYYSPDKKVNHLINPRSGYSVASCTSVTVIASSNTRTDALATAIYVMGPEAGLNLVRSFPDTECLIVGTDQQIITSPGLAKYLVKNS